MKGERQKVFSRWLVVGCRGHKKETLFSERRVRDSIINDCSVAQVGISLKEMRES